MTRLTVIMVLILSGLTVTAQEMRSNNLPDTLYYKHGVKQPCKITSINSWDVELSAKSDDSSLNEISVSQKLLDSAYTTSSFGVTHNQPKVGTNLIVSGVTTFVSAISIFVGVQLEQLEEAAFVAGISSVISTASLINAGVVSNAQEPPPKNLKHIIVF